MPESPCGDAREAVSRPCMPPRPEDQAVAAFLRRTAAVDQYESELMVSPFSLVPSAHHVGIAIVDLTNRALPSHIATLQPPGWLLEAFT